LRSGSSKLSFVPKIMGKGAVSKRLNGANCENSSKSQWNSSLVKYFKDNIWTLSQFFAVARYQRKRWKHLLLLHGHINLHFWWLQSNSLDKVKVLIPKHIKTSTKLSTAKRVAAVYKHQYQVSTSEGREQNI